LLPLLTDIASGILVVQSYIGRRQ